jgi:hypothetical protein
MAQDKEIAMAMTSFCCIDNDREPIACYAVTRELSANLDSHEAFVAQFGRQSIRGYRPLAT